MEARVYWGCSRCGHGASPVWPEAWCPICGGATTRHLVAEVPSDEVARDGAERPCDLLRDGESEEVAGEPDREDAESAHEEEV